MPLNIHFYGLYNLAMLTAEKFPKLEATDFYHEIRRVDTDKVQ